LLLSLLLLTLSCSTSIWCCTPTTCCGFRVGMSRHGWYNDPVLWPLDPLNKSLYMVNIRIKVHLDLQADKSSVVVKGPFFPQV
jgi:hypothetical protein